MPAAPSVGDLIDGKYLLERVLGQGAVGCVFEATHTLLGDQVAIKLLQSDAPSPSSIERFLREARVVRAIQSPHAVKVFEVGQLEGGSPFIVMERLQGSNLADHLRSCGSLPLSQVAELVIQACDGLAEAHRSGVVHRDIKPENLFLCANPDGTRSLKVLDFGVAKMLSPEASNKNQLRTAGAIGTPLFMSPEQIQGLAVDARSDVWALGVLIFHLLTEQFPFESPTIEGLAVQICTAEPRSLEALAPGLPAGVLGLVRGCLEKNLDSRVASIAEVAIALRLHAPARSEAQVERICRLLDAAAAPRFELAPVSAGRTSVRVAPVEAGDTAAADTQPESAAPLTPAPGASPPRIEPAASVASVETAAPARPWRYALPLAPLLLLGWLAAPGRGGPSAPATSAAPGAESTAGAAAEGAAGAVAAGASGAPLAPLAPVPAVQVVPSVSVAASASAAAPRGSAPRRPPAAAPPAATPAATPAAAPAAAPAATPAVDPKQASIRDRK